jgi:glutamate-ammonia-ligase adenylyltransferase
VPGEVCICALGKFGGREIGYASDIELLFIWRAERGSGAAEYFESVAQHVVNSIRSKRDGIFELDLRLRPGGRNAPLASSYKRFTDYFSADGGADVFERQALVRLRPVAGDPALIADVCAHRQAYVFGPTPFDVARIVHLRQRQQQELVRPGQVNAKHSAGGVVDAEYAIQILQVYYGADNAALQSPNTVAAAEALHAAGVLSAAELRRFVDGYRFLRALINSMRIVRGNAKDLVLPEPESDEFLYLERRLRNFGFLAEAEEGRDRIRGEMAQMHAFFEELPGRLPASS